MTMRRYVFAILLCLTVVSACSNESFDDERLVGTWKLISLDYTKQINGEDPLPLDQRHFLFEEEKQPVWVIEKSAEGYTISGTDLYGSQQTETFTTNDGLVSFLGKRLFYYGQEYNIVSLSKKSMEWRCDRYDNHYGYNELFGEYYYLAEHSVLVFQRAD